MDRYELDVYGYVSVTNFKYVVFKIEQRLNPVNGSTNAERQMKQIFERVQSFHTSMMLNPFFNFDSHGSFLTGGNSNPGRMTVGRSNVILGEEDDMSDYSSSSCSSCNSSNNEQ